MSELFTFPERVEYLKRYGSGSMSFATLQPGLRFFDLRGVGYLAYAVQWGVCYVLSEPVCAAGDVESLLGAFIREHPRCNFAQMAPATAEIIGKLFHFCSTPVGIETVLRCDGFNLHGRKKQIIRTAINHARGLGIRIVENAEGTDEPLVSAEWMKSRKASRKEITFLIRPARMEYQEGCRKFFVYQGERLLGYVFFDPMYRDNRVIGYTPSISRFTGEFRYGLFYLVISHAMEVFRQEGIEQVNLGLSIFYTTPVTHAYESAWTRHIFDVAFRLNMLYNFQGVRFTKSRFCGEEVDVFFCHQPFLPLKEIVGMFRLTGTI